MCTGKHSIARQLGQNLRDAFSIYETQPFDILSTVSNVIFKTVSGSRTSKWREAAEEHARNGVAFIIRPFHKSEHWEFLEALCERYDMQPTFRAVEKSVSFTPRSKNE